MSFALPIRQNINATISILPFLNRNGLGCLPHHWINRRCDRHCAVESMKISSAEEENSGNVAHNLLISLVRLEHVSFSIGGFQFGMLQMVQVEVISRKFLFKLIDRLSFKNSIFQSFKSHSLYDRPLCEYFQFPWHVSKGINSTCRFAKIGRQHENSFEGYSFDFMWPHRIDFRYENYIFSRNLMLLRDSYGTHDYTSIHLAIHMLICIVHRPIRVWWVWLRHINLTQIK